MTDQPAQSASRPKAADADRIAAGYATTGAALEFGAVVLDGSAYPEAQVRVSLAMMNRHGVIAGATGTGKTKTLQSKYGQPIDRESAYEKLTAPAVVLWAAGINAVRCATAR